MQILQYEIATKILSNLKQELFDAIGHQEATVRSLGCFSCTAGSGTSQKECRHRIQLCYLHKKWE